MPNPAENVWQTLHDEDCPGHSQDELDLIADGIRSSKLVCKTCHTEALRQLERDIWEAAADSCKLRATKKMQTYQSLRDQGASSDDAGYTKNIIESKEDEFLEAGFRRKSQEVGKEGE